MAERSESLLGRAARAGQEFLRLESAGGLVLLAAAAFGMLVANSALAAHYEALLDLPVEVRAGSAGIAKSLRLWIDDGLMAVFFLLVGLELKREAVEGHFSSLRRASLPACAALGGMAVPAAIYLAFNAGDSIARQGWAIPSATDIAFALGMLSLLGPRVPSSLKAFLLGVAIFDDLGAIVVIALFYTGGISGTALAVAAVLVMGLAVLNRSGVRRLAPYFLLGVPLWVAVLKSGVHATLAGVVVALFVPLRAEGEGSEEEEASPLHRLEHTLHPWVAFGVLPVFAFANAGVRLHGLAPADLLGPAPLGIAAGLVLGKLAGVLGGSFLAVRLGIARLPSGTSWRELTGIALLCGIGFTMALFLASLAFEEGGGGPAGVERLGILCGSLVAGIAGLLVLRRTLPAAAAPEASPPDAEPG